MNKIPILQSASPNLLSPSAYYQWYQSHSGLQEKIKNYSKSSKQDKLNRALLLYYEIAKKMIEDLKPQYVHDEESLNEYIQKLESRIDNKLRLEEEGNKFILINGKYRFDGSDDIYEEYFQSGKKQFAEIVKGIASELRKTILGELLNEEPGKAFISDISYNVNQEKKEDPKTVAVDLDGTLIDDQENAISGAVEFLNKLKENGFEVVLYTARYAATPQEEYQSLTNHIEGILKKNNLQVDRISIEKPLSMAFIDNSAVNFNGNNYDEILDLLLNKNINESEFNINKEFKKDWDYFYRNNVGSKKELLMLDVEEIKRRLDFLIKNMTKVYYQYYPNSKEGDYKKFWINVLKDEIEYLKSMKTEIAATISTGSPSSTDKNKEPEIAGVIIEEEKKSISKSFSLLKKDEIAKKIYDQIGKELF